MYFGNCAEYCGTQHANMLLRVIVQTREGFEKWVAQQRGAHRTASNAGGNRGASNLFANSCVNCHKVSDSVAVGVFGPDLSKLMMRQTIGAGSLLSPEKTSSHGCTIRRY